RTSAPALRLPSALRRCCVYCDGARRDLHSFPTRRSSDLGAERPAPFTAAGADKLVVLAGVVQHQDVVDHDLQPVGLGIDHDGDRSEEHTSELQSRENLVCRLLLEKKNNMLIATATPH